jgi:hypothetical protein
MPIVPDTKDWTWVLDRPCPECGFEASAVPRERIAPMIRENAEAWPPMLAQPGSRLRERPADDRWSALEYACHVRDVFRLFEQRLTLMRTEADPAYPNWDQDLTAVEDRYNEQDPARVAAEILEAASTVAAGFETVEGSEWERPGTRSDGAHFTIDTFARYLLHDPVHHLHDVRQAVGIQPGRPRS